MTAPLEIRTSPVTDEPEPIVPVNPAADADPNEWVPIAPWVTEDHAARDVLRACVSRLSETGTDAAPLAEIRRAAVTRANALGASLAPALVFCLHVVCDLCAQGWALRVDSDGIAARPPRRGAATVSEDKARVRAAHLVERDAQLDQAPVRRFLAQMERRRLHNGAWHSVFSLMRDGRELAAALRAANDAAQDGERAWALRAAIDPYVQVVAAGATCAHTGLALGEVWRYFRHTWTMPYQSTPGRKLFFLIRDRAAPNHPVVGIGALGSAVVQLSVRDEWIGWTAPRLLDELRRAPTASWARWLRDTLDGLIEDIFVRDFMAERVLRPAELAEPTAAAVECLSALATAERHTHRLYPARGQHKRAPNGPASTGADWAAQARTHLFRSKRAGALAELLEAKRLLQAAGFRRASAAALRRVLSDAGAARAIRTVLRYTKAAHVGVDMMDVTVCGAVAPYNDLLGGKLVALLMASPEVRVAYRRRYRRASSVIASSMAGRPVQRRPRLVLLGTTSLYGAGSSQYNRVRMPAAAVGGPGTAQVAYHELGRTAGYGSYHFSRDTMAALEIVLRQLQRGRQVNSIFGEGVNPRLRKVRGALDAVSLPSDLLLQHGSPRLVYAVPLATNFRDVLVGRAKRATYVVPDRPDASDSIAEYWRTRWLARRAVRPEVLERVAAHTRTYPVRHGARVVLPQRDSLEGPLFAPPAADDAAPR